ncbi:UNKNOWN [Stylonychia lemnae]|uniref:Uncharacterized protein n=1 Tax=Stylonychia lemnae TaxID=5949 RepID=A0A077ZVR6_STYLE|nr:UNKNOWN [Stylonychia lemnae]|eukprot:CDW74035.1 UNKNOWN [Stylonychia lemnae]
MKSMISIYNVQQNGNTNQNLQLKSNNRSQNDIKIQNNKIQHINLQQDYPYVSDFFSKRRNTQSLESCKTKSQYTNTMTKAQTTANRFGNKSYIDYPSTSNYTIDPLSNMNKSVYNNNNHSNLIIRRQFDQMPSSQSILIDSSTEEGIKMLQSRKLKKQTEIEMERAETLDKYQRNKHQKIQELRSEELFNYYQTVVESKKSDQLKTLVNNSKISALIQIKKQQCLSPSKISQAAKDNIQVDLQQKLKVKSYEVHIDLINEEAVLNRRKIEQVKLEEEKLRRQIEEKKNQHKNTIMKKIGKNRKLSLLQTDQIQILFGRNTTLTNQIQQIQTYQNSLQQSKLPKSFIKESNQLYQSNHRESNLNQRENKNDGIQTNYQVQEQDEEIECFNSDDDKDITEISQLKNHNEQSREHRIEQKIIQQELMTNSDIDYHKQQFIQDKDDVQNSQNYDKNLETAFNKGQDFLIIQTSTESKPNFKIQKHSSQFPEVKNVKFNYKNNRKLDENIYLTDKNNSDKNNDKILESHNNNSIYENGQALKHNNTIKLDYQYSEDEQEDDKIEFNNENDVYQNDDSNGLMNSNYGHKGKSKQDYTLRSVIEGDSEDKFDQKSNDLNQQQANNVILDQQAQSLSDKDDAPQMYDDDFERE